MEALELARLQFGVTTVYHYIFVPLTIGLSPIVAIMQTLWLRTGDEKWFRLTKFFGKLLLINFAIGIVTGIVQEFQFGMNWSEYSRFVGDVFGAPLAMEALLAFFLESTFLGLWIFGWDRLPRKVHLATAWAFAIGTWLSAYFIIAANSFMQHPVGVTYNEERGRAELTSIWAVLTNSTTLAAFPHVIFGALLSAGTFVAGIAAWWMVRSFRAGHTDDAAAFRKATRMGAIVLIVAGLGLFATGDLSAKLMFEQQPMKMNAAEAHCDTEAGVEFSVFAIGNPNNECDVFTVGIPKLTSYLATGDFNAELPGVNEVQAESEALYGVGVDYKPNLAATYWSFRFMMGFAVFSGLLAVAVLWATRKQNIDAPEWFAKLGLIALPMPFIANCFGWIFTEMGRQPWVVAPNPGSNGVDGVWMLVASGVSNHPAWLVWTSLAVFTLVYGIGMVFWFSLMKQYVLHGLPDEQPVDPLSDDDDAELSFAY